MTTRRRHAVVALFFTLLIARLTARAQPPDGDAVFQALRVQARALRDSLGDVDQLARIAAHLGVLDKARSAALGGRIAPEYRDSLLADAAVLERASAMLRRGDRKGALAAVQDAEDDLAIKRRHIEAATGFSGAGLGIVDVTARTIRGSKEEPGHIVWFVARGWAEDRQRYARFDGLSSPTAALLAPGKYLIWAGAQSDQRRQPIDIGGHGRSRQTIDLLLP
jgi:hypothetical protein